MKIEDVIAWIKKNYTTAEITPTRYEFEGDWANTIDCAICKVRQRFDEKEYHKKHSISVEHLCKELEQEFKEGLK